MFYDGSRMELLQSEVVDTQTRTAPAAPSRPPSVPISPVGLELREAVRRAKTYITGALHHSLTIGQGSGPVGHFWNVTYPTD